VSIRARADRDILRADDTDLAFVAIELIDLYGTLATMHDRAITVVRGAGRQLVDDPFARLFPARILRVEGGVLGRVPLPCEPTIERYGSARPWPWDRFD